MSPARSNMQSRKWPKRSLSDLNGSIDHMKRARKVIPLGVSSSRRARQRPTPIAIAHAHGSYVYDVDGNDYIDYLAGWGPMILGHQPSSVVDAAGEQLKRGSHFAMAHEGELQLAERVTKLVPSADKVTFLSSGSEAVHLALAIARGATRRKKILKFDGHFHGWLYPMTTNLPGMPPVSAHRPHRANPVAGWDASPDVVICPWNDLDALEFAMKDQGDGLAALIIEPVASNAGSLSPLPGYLERVRELCTQYGVVLIFDEVITGFRLGLGGAQERFGVTPDLTTFAKAIANGFPISAVAGSDDIMSAASSGPIRTLGTYNGNPVATAAANATLTALEDGGSNLYRELDRHGEELAAGFRKSSQRHGLKLHVNHVGSMLGLLWGLDHAPTTYADSTFVDVELAERVEEELALRGILTADGKKMFISTAHSSDDIAATVQLFDDALNDITS